MQHNLKPQYSSKNRDQSSSKEVESGSSVVIVRVIIVRGSASFVGTTDIASTAMSIVSALNTVLFTSGASRSGRSAVGIVQTLNTLLFGSRASRIRVAAVGISQTFDASFLGVIASRSTGGTIRVGFTSVWEYAKGVIAALGSSGFSSSPVNKRAVSIGGTFYAATSFQVAVRLTVIQALIISGTEVYANVGKSIAVGLVINFTTIRVTARFTGGSASVATTVLTAVRSGSRAIGIDLARSAGSITLASRLTRGLTTVKNSAVSVGSASLASTIGLAIVSASVLLATIVVLSVGLTDVGINAPSKGANSVSSHRGRSVIGTAISVASATYTTSIFHAVLRSCAVLVSGTSRCADVSRANSFVSKISSPCVVGTAISIISAVQAKTVGHAVSSLGICALIVVVARVDALASSLIAIDLSRVQTTIEGSTSGRGISDDARQAL
jgi:hypothetical protein